MLNQFETFRKLEELESETWGTELTPVERHGDCWVKRDDTYERAGVLGGKVRSAWYLCTKEPVKGLVTAGAKASPQIKIIASIAKELGVPFHAHTPSGELGPEVTYAQSIGAEVYQHRPGYNNVIIKRAFDDALEMGYLNVPFGMECEEAVLMTALQVRNIPESVERIVAPVGSSMSFAGVLWGLEYFGRTDVKALGVSVGAKYDKRMAQYAPPGWENWAEIVKSPYKYSDRLTGVKVGELEVDPVYEAKCVEYLESDDLFWVVGIR